MATYPLFQLHDLHSTMASSGGSRKLDTLLKRIFNFKRSLTFILHTFVIDTKLKPVINDQHFSIVRFRLHEHDDGLREFSQVATAVLQEHLVRPNQAFSYQYVVSR